MKSSAREVGSSRLPMGNTGSSTIRSCSASGSAASITTARPSLPCEGATAPTTASAQTATHVVILAELMHEARIVRLDSEHPPEEVLSYAGDSIGWWDGDTLVVDTTNFRRQGVAMAASERRRNSRSSSGVPHEGLHIVERFTPQEDGSLFYEFSVDDPDYAATWGGSSPWLRTDQRIYEYACHEGNYSLGMTMRGARQLEKEWSEGR